jgi:hypothetical protein
LSKHLYKKYWLNTAFFHTSTDSSKCAELDSTKDHKNAIRYLLVTVTGSVICFFASKRDDLGQTHAVVYASTAQRRMLHRTMILCTAIAWYWNRQSSRHH